MPRLRIQRRRSQKIAVLVSVAACIMACGRASNTSQDSRLQPLPSRAPTPKESPNPPVLAQPTQSRWQLNDRFPPNAKGAKIVAQIHALSENFTEIFPSMLIGCEKTTAALFLRPESFDGFERGITQIRLDYTIDDEKPVETVGSLILSSGVMQIGGLPLIENLFEAKRFSVVYHTPGAPDPAPLYFSVTGSGELRDRLRQLCPQVAF